MFNPQDEIITELDRCIDEAFERAEKCDIVWRHNELECAKLKVKHRHWCRENFVQPVQDGCADVLSEDISKCNDEYGDENSPPPEESGLV